MTVFEACTSLVVLAFALLPSFMHGAQTVTLRAMSPVQVKEARSHFDPQQVPEGMVFEIDPSEAFLLSLPGSKAIAILNITYGLPGYSQHGAARRCGLSFLDGQGSSYLVSLIGSKASDPTCIGLDALGLMTHEGAHPRILAEVRAVAPNGNYGDWPFVLVWDAHASRYALDEKSSDYLLGVADGSGKLSTLRTLLAHRGTHANSWK